MKEGIALLNAIQDVYLNDEITNCLIFNPTGCTSLTTHRKQMSWFKQIKKKNTLYERKRKKHLRDFGINVLHAKTYSLQRNIQTITIYVPSAATMNGLDPKNILGFYLMKIISQNSMRIWFPVIL